MNLAGIKSHFANWRAWELNPIVVKELRQAVRSWAVTGMLLLFLAVLLVVSIGFLVFQSFDVDPDRELGGAMFSAFAVILSVASIFFIPLYMGIRMAAERQENNPDLLYISTLSPARIIRGKFLCGAYMALLFFSACMPFMAFTNLLRGVDLPTVFFILFYLYLAVCAANMAAICLSCIPVNRAFKVLFVVLGFPNLFWMIITAVSYSFIFMRSGVGATMGERNFWIGTLTAVAVCAAVTGLFYVLAVALVSPQSANRALPVRIYVTVMWLLGGLLALGWVAKTGDSDVVYAWSIPSFLMMIFSLLVVISNSDRISQRVRRTIPQPLWKRIPAFLFYNGAAGGIVWVALIVLATAFAAHEIIDYSPKKILTGSERPWFGAVSAYIFDYALTAVFIQRKFLSRRPVKLTGLLAVLLAVLWATAPSIILFFLNQLTVKTMQSLELGNIFNVFAMQDDARAIYHLYFAFGWLAIIGALNARWFFSMAQNFRPPPLNTPPVISP